MRRRYRSGRHFLQIPGPTNVPDKVLQATAQPVIDHRSVEFAAIAKDVLEGLRWVTRSQAPIALYASSGTGALEAALANTLSPGDKILLCECGAFARRWGNVAQRLGLEVVRLEDDWRRGPDPNRVESRLRADRDHEVRALLVVHNETSTGVMADVPALRAALDAAGHPALLLVDTVSSLGSVDYRHDEWRVDVTIGASQKGLMLPPGLSFNVVGEHALAASRTAKLARSYWDWGGVLPANETGFFPYTPATNMLRGLSVAIELLHAEGLESVFARHESHAASTRAAVQAWGLEVYCLNEEAHSRSVTGVLVPGGVDADEIRRVAREQFNLSLGGGLDKLEGRLFRIGHLGDFNDLMLAGTLCGVELALRQVGFQAAGSGAVAALAHLGGQAYGRE